MKGREIREDLMRHEVSMMRKRQRRAYMDSHITEERMRYAAHEALDSQLDSVVRGDTCGDYYFEVGVGGGELVRATCRYLGCRYPGEPRGYRSKSKR